MEYKHYKNSGAPFFLIPNDYRTIFQDDEKYQILIEDEKGRKIPALAKVKHYTQQSPRLVITGTRLPLEKNKIYYIRIHSKK